MDTTKDRLGSVNDLKPGDIFYTTEADLDGAWATCVWTVPCEAFITVGGGIFVDGKDVGYVAGGVLRSMRWRLAKEVTIACLE